MNIDIDRDTLRGRSLFVGTPMYGGQCHADFAFSIARLSALCTQLGVGLRFYFHCRESLIMRARNVIADEFLRAGDSHLIFIDGDMGFDPRDVIYLLALQAEDAGADTHDVLTAPYPRKQMAWGTVAAAAKLGAGDDDPDALARYASDLVFRPATAEPFAATRPVEVEVAGTGFMMIRRATLEQVRRAYPHLAYWPDTLPTDPQGPREMFAFFDTSLDSKAGNLAEELELFLHRNPQASHADIRAFLADPAAVSQSYSGHFISEDYTFCRRVRQAGMRIWSCPWMQLTHTGTYTFESSLAHISALRHPQA